MMRKLVLLVLAGWFSCAVAQTAQQALPPAASDPAFEQRIKALETELRCLVCQNQTLAESPAGLADDLRREIRGLAQQGKTDDEIKQFLQSRYGDFILYKPQVKESTWVLWGGPFALLLLGAVIFAVILRRRAKLLPPPDRDEAALQRARTLLSDSPAAKPILPDQP
jgi:cytochrome c-type biogenesis protein CcmH